MPKVKHVGKYEIQSDRSYPVRHAIDTETGKRYVVKAVPTYPDRLLEVEHEVNALRRLHHPNVLKLIESISSKRHVYVILELTTGDVFDLIVMNEKEHLDEPTAWSLFQQLVAGLLHCHRNGVAHRDVKPENMRVDDQGTLKLSEFGMSVLSAGSCEGEVDKMPMQATSGIPSCVAPELLRRSSYDYFKADAWSCGVVLFAMLSGKSPFDSATIPELFNLIRTGSYTMPDVMPSGAADLIDCLLVVDPAKRLSLEEITEHPWFANGFDPTLLSGE